MLRALLAVSTAIVVISFASLGFAGEVGGANPAVFALHVKAHTNKSCAETVNPQTTDCSTYSVTGASFEGLGGDPLDQAAFFDRLQLGDLLKVKDGNGDGIADEVAFERRHALDGDDCEADDGCDLEDEDCEFDDDCDHHDDECEAGDDCSDDSCERGDDCSAADDHCESGDDCRADDEHEDDHPAGDDHEHDDEHDDEEEHDD